VIREAEFLMTNNTNNDFKAVDVCYMYDGSFYGMLSCVFESFELKEMPVQITSSEFSLFRIKYIETDEAKAQRILKGVAIKIGGEALKHIKLSFLANIENKEIALIHFLIEGFKYGRKFIQRIYTGFSPPSKVVVASAINNPYIAKLSKGIDLLTLEGHKFVQFVRFSEINGALVSIIEPENNVLPLLAEHFIDRFINEQFLIYDKTRKLGLIYTDNKARIEFIDYEMPVLSKEEKDYQKLWRLFYNTIAIKERKNERCRMNFMPKKYWKNMTEFLTE